jgi:hypothetical protein
MALMETSEGSDEVVARPVAPLGWWRRALGGALGAGVWVGVAVCVWMLVRPRVEVVVAGDRTTIQISPEMMAWEWAALWVAFACAGLAWVAVGWRRSIVLGLVLAVVLPVVVWHQNAARVVITPDTLTAPTEGRLLPGAPATVRFDRVAWFWLTSRDKRSGRSQHCQMKDGRQIWFELGPLIDEAGPLIEQYGRERGARVSWAP